MVHDLLNLPDLFLVATLLHLPEHADYFINLTFAKVVDDDTLRLVLLSDFFLSTLLLFLIILRVLLLVGMLLHCFKLVVAKSTF